MKYLTKSSRKEYILNNEQWKILVNLPGYRGASLYETMGPNWKDIYWSPRNSPSVVTKMDREEIKLKLGVMVQKRR